MQNENRRRRLIALIFLTLAFIWGNSLLPGSISGAISDAVGAFLSRFLGSALVTASGHGVLRKLAHGTEYMILGIELTALFRGLQRRPLSLLLLSGMSAALVDDPIIPNSG